MTDERNPAQPRRADDPTTAAAARDRRMRLRRRLLAALVLVLIVTSPFLAVRFGFVRSAMLRMATERAGLTEDYRVVVESVRRFGPLGFHLGGVALEVRDSTGAYAPAVRLGHLAAEWSLSRLLVGEVVVSRFQAGAVTVHADRLPRETRTGDPGPVGPEASRPGPLSSRVPIRVDQVSLGPVEVFDAGGSFVRFGVTEAEFVASGRDLTLFLHQGWLALDRYGIGLQMGGGVFVWRGGQGSELSGLQIDGPRLRGQVRARYDQEADSPLTADMVVEHLDPRILSRNFVPSIRLRPEDRLAGSVGVRVGTGVLIDFVLNGRLRAEAFDLLTAQIESRAGRVYVRDMIVEGESGRVTGEGHWDGPERQARGRVRFQRLDPATRWLPWLEEAPVTDRFSGAGNVVVSVPRGFPVRVEGDVELYGARPFRIGTETIRFRGSVEPGDAVSASEVRILGDGGAIRAEGRWPLGTGEVDIRAQVDSFPLAALPDAWRTGAAGRLWGTFDLSGASQDPVIEGSCRITGLARDPWRADRVTIAPLLLWPKDQRGSATLEFYGLRRGEAAPIRLSARASRWDEWISLATDVRVPGLELHAQGQLDPRGRVGLRRLTLDSNRWGRWRLDAPLRFLWAGDSLQVDSLRLSSEEARLAASGRWLRTEDEVALDLTLDRFDLARLTDPARGRIDWGGQGDLRLAVAGRLPDPQVHARLTADSLRIGPAQLGRVELTAGWRESTLTVAPLTLRSDAHEVVCPELTLCSAQPLLASVWPAEADSGASVAAPLAQAPWEGRVRIDRLDWAEWAPVLGLHGADSASDRAVRVERTIGGRPVTIRVETAGDAPTAPAGAGGFGGEFRGDLVLGGRPGAPSVTLRGEAEDVIVAGVPTGSLEVDLSYTDSTFVVRKCALTGPASQSWIKGCYPYHLQLLPPRAARRAAPVEISGLFENLNVRLLSGFTRYVPDAHGRLSGAVTIGGLGTAPRVTGSMLLRDGGFRVPGRSERIYEAEAIARLDSLGLHIEQLSARTGDNGRLAVEGWVRDTGDFDLTARAEQVRVFEQGNYEFLVNADSLRALTGPHADVVGGVESDAHTGPHLVGRVEVLRGQYMPDLGGPEGAPARAEAPSPWRVDLDVIAPGNIRVTQPNATAELGEGQLRLSYRWPYWNVSGSIAVLGGTYRLLNNNFSITGGAVEFRDTGQGPRAEVSVEAETYVVSADTTDTSADDIRVMVTVEGEPEELQVALSSEPPYSQEQIVELLSYGRLPRSAWEAASETPTLLLGTMGGAIESSLAEQFPIFAHVGLEHGATAQDMRLSVRPMISPGITGNYSQELSLDPAWDFSLHYRLSRILYLRAGVANDPERAGPFIDEYSLDLKFRFEYE